MKSVWALGGLVAGLLAVPASARDWVGDWAARTADRTYAIVAITGDAQHGWDVDLSRPVGSHVRLGGLIEHLGPEVGHLHLHAVAAGVDRFRLTHIGARPDEQSGYGLSAMSDGQLWLSFGSGGSGMLLSPARKGEMVSTDWADDEANLVEHWPDNAVMSALFAEDQADRKPAAGQKIDWSVIHPRDEARRARTQELIDAGALRSGADFYHAAFVFQHGEAPADFLKAHALAIAAAARGYGMAAWIAAASLDRYLLNKGQPQVFGTQFQTPDDGPVTQEPYDRAMLTDGLRAVASVPSLAEQEKEREGYEARRSAIRAASPAKGS